MKYEIPIYFDFKCKFCKKTYSTKKRLPEDHECEGLREFKKERQEAIKRGEKPMMYMEYLRNRLFYDRKNKTRDERPNYTSLSPTDPENFEPEEDYEYEEENSELKFYKGLCFIETVFIALILLMIFYFFGIW
jgi:hypothetical protein